MKQFTEKKIEFIAKTITDLGKAILWLEWRDISLRNYPLCSEYRLEY